MNKSTSVLLIGADRSYCDHCISRLRVECQVTVTEDPEKGLQMARDRHPDVVMVSIGAERFDGLEVCRQLKNDPDTRDIPVVAISGENTLEEKILGYNVGVDDFLIIPCSPVECVGKIEFIQKHHEIEHQLAEQAKMATETALSVMAGSSELGLAIRFVERSYDAVDYQDLANRLLHVIEELRLKGCLYFKTIGGDLFFATGDSIRPLEKELLTRVHQEGARFKDFGKRTFVIFSRVALLIKNMPLDEPEHYGRVKDLLPSILGAADEKIRALDTERALVDQTRNISASFSQVRETLQDLARAFVTNQDETMKVMREMLTELDFKIPSMGLEEDQERYLVERIDGAIQDATALMDQGENLHAAFHHISVLLDFLAEQQQKITEQVIHTPPPETETNTADGDLDGDIELF
jgi:DNA-binding response OmpR family regulator